MNRYTDTSEENHMVLPEYEDLPEADEYDKYDDDNWGQS
jgi:hypothetical protein